MNAQTPFQFLPCHIVQLIVNYVEFTRDKELLRPLLQVCHNVRIVALPLYFSHFRLMLANSINSRLASTDMIIGRVARKYRVNSYLGYPTHHLASALNIELDEEDMYSGIALRLLSREPYDGCAFPRVLTINFHFELGADIQVEQSVAAANIGALVQRINSMAPRAKKFTMSLRASEVAVHRTGHHIDDLVTRLSKLVGNIDINTYRSRSDLRDLRLEGVHNLVYLELMCHPSSTINLLAQRNASTLEFLCISFSNTNGVPGIIQDTDGTYISYPYLATLELRGNTDNANDLPPLFGGYVPFPILRRLVIRCVYPFRENILFRGNSATLEHLSMRLSNSIVVILRRHRVFTPESHPKLQYVRVWNAFHRVPDIFATNAEALQFILSIGTTASTRITDIHITGTELTGVTTSLTNLNSIQYLSLAQTALDLWDTITLIKSHPLLSDLRTGSPNIGTLPDGITLDDLPAYVVSTLAPMGIQFRRWFLVGQVEENSLKCILLLALACPKFWYASTKYVRHELVLPMMEQAIASDMFKPYSPRLQNFKFLGTAIKGIQFLNIG